MSDGVKIAIGVGAVAIVGYFVVTKIAAPKVVPRNTAPSNTATAFFSGIVPAFTSFFSKSSPANAPLANIDRPLTSDQISSVNEFRSESPDMTDAQRDAAFFS